MRERIVLLAVEVCVVVALCWCWGSAWGASGIHYALEDPDFERGSLEGWETFVDGLEIGACTSTSFNRFRAARIHGEYASGRWITNVLWQRFSIKAGDVVSAVGFIWWRTNEHQSSEGAAELSVSFSGRIESTTNVWTDVTGGWTFFEIYGGLGGTMNGGFEEGSLKHWMVGADDLELTVSREEAVEGQYALRMHGTWTNGWSWNHVSQGMTLSSGEIFTASAKMRIDRFSKDGGWAVAGIKLEDNYGSTLIEDVRHATTNTEGWVTLELTYVVPSSDFYVFRCFVCGDAGSGGRVEADVFFDDVRAQRKPISVADGSFESGNLEEWSVGTDDLAAGVSAERAKEGAYSLHFNGSWDGWSFNQASQGFYFPSGAVVRARGWLWIEDFSNSAGWAVAGLKLERQGGGGAFERSYDQGAPRGQWLDLSLDAVITNAGVYDFRCMVCGDVGGGSAVADVYFDDIQLSMDGAPTGTTVDAELAITFKGWSGGEAFTSRVDIYVDSIMLSGSSADAQPVYESFEALADWAEGIASDAAEDDIPEVEYPPLYAYGYPAGETNPVLYPSVAEVCIPAWRFKYFTNDVAIVWTNTLITAPLGGAGYIEFDQYMYCARSWQTDRGAPLDTKTGMPYFVLGQRDGVSSEFGSGPFPEVHTYTVGDPLNNFPRRIVSVYDGQWPTRLNIVFQENLTNYDRRYDKYFCIYSIVTNAADCGCKSLWVELNGYDSVGDTNFHFRSQEIHMGWASEEETRGMVDYPNCTYQDHNEVAVRAPWKYAVLNRDDWFVQQVPRGSATIEPVEMYLWESGWWTYRAYEEYLFTWPNAASGVRSIWDDDTVDAVPGPASYLVGYKIGHLYGTNELGEPVYPAFLEIRGNGYFRMTDKDGVMGGSFRPVSMDIFGIFQGVEDAPLMPEAYLSLMSRTTCTNSGDDDSYLQVAIPVRSKTNQWLVGALNFKGYFTPSETPDGVYFELESDILANRAIARDEHGWLNAFAQVDMYWRGNMQINGGDEAHDVDVIMVNKADGEWVTHYPLNPPSNVYHRTLTTLQSNDTVYIMQQDRGADSYGYNPEAPYRKVSSMEITLLDDGGRRMKLDVYEQSTLSEINDNVVIAGAIDEDLSKGEKVHYRYRYRTVYAPGVTILNPNSPDGGDNWSNNAYLIEVLATDGDDSSLCVDLYYGNGRADDWTHINTNELLLVPETDHRVSYLWDVSQVPAGAYYIRAEARRLDGSGRIGFDVSDSRLQVGRTIGLPNNVPAESGVVTNEYGYLGTNMSFETGGLHGWAVGTDHLQAGASPYRTWDGIYSCRMTGSWAQAGQSNVWSWNCVAQEISCLEGEVLRVQGRIYIAHLENAGTNWIRCGIKMESTNKIGRTSSGQEFDGRHTGVWINVDFERTAPVTGTDRLLLWVAGYDGSAVDVFFDDLRVMSTNQGTVVTNEYREGYWASDDAIDASETDVLAFHLAMSDPDPGLQVWLADAEGVTNSVPVTNYLAHILSLSQYVVVPWEAFPTVSPTQIVAMGVRSPAEKNAQISGVRFTRWPIVVTTEFPHAPNTNQDGVVHYNPGQDVIEVITLSNATATALTNIRIQLLQEYAETTYWWESSPHGPARWSEKTRRGDRLCGMFECNWSNITIPAGGRLVLTNIYTVPEGKLVDHTWTALPDGEDWYIFRNYPAYAQLHIVLREPGGNTVADVVPAGMYSMDDDYDMDDDGLPDSWERQYGGCDTCMLPGADPDGDTYTNLEEYEAGSDPTDPNSYPGHISSYVLHLAYTNGTDLFPRAAAEQSNYTAAACGWMIARYLNGESFTQSQSQIYAENTNSPEHNYEITPQSIAGWMYHNAPPQFYFAARYRWTLDDALKEAVYWMDYLPPGGKKTPVYIVCNTNWSYKVLRGFETDKAPYDGGFGVTTQNVFTIYGLWLNDPSIDGLGYDVYVTASEMTNIYLASEADGRRWLVAEPPRDADELQRAESFLERTSIRLEPSAPNAGLGRYLRLLAMGEKPRIRRAKSWQSDAGYDLYDAVPSPLRNDAGFTSAFYRASVTNCYLVNTGDGDSEYLLAAGGDRGPMKTYYVMKLDTNGAFGGATWVSDPVMYPPVSFEAARWLALRRSGFGTAESDMLANGGFEENSGGDEPVTPDQWVTGGAAGSYSWASRSGTWGMAVIGWGSPDGCFYQDVTATAAEDYSFLIWMQKDDSFTAATVEVKLEWFDAYMNRLGEVSTGVLDRLDSGWQLVRVDGKAPADATKVRCTVWCVGITANGGALKCDDALLLSGSNRAVVLDARLIYDPQVDVSPFYPRWEITLSSPSGIVISTVGMFQPELDKDSDGDGMSDRLELYAGSDPEDSCSTFSCRGLAGGSPQAIILRWNSVSGRTYSVWRGTNLLEPFELRYWGIEATPPVNELVEPMPEQRVFYRIEVE